MSHNEVLFWGKAAIVWAVAAWLWSGVVCVTIEWLRGRK